LIALKSRSILIVGLDGAGKTTHAQHLIKELAKKGVRTRYVYMRGYGRAFLTLPFLGLSRLLGFTKVHTLKNGNRVSEYRFFSNKAFRILWPWFSLVDSLLYSFFVFGLTPLFLSKQIISDRSPIDTLVDIIADTRDPYPFKRYWRYFLNLVPKNSVVVFLDVDENTALHRKKDVLNMEYLKIRRATYKELAHKYGWAAIDTVADFEIVHSNFLKVLSLNNQSTVNELNLTQRNIQ
jgi:thymidylate kinase